MSKDRNLMILSDLPNGWAEACIKYVGSLLDLPITQSALSQIWYGTQTWWTAADGMANWDWAAFHEPSPPQAVPPEVTAAMAAWVDEWPIGKTLCLREVSEMLQAATTPPAQTKCIFIHIIKPALRQIAIACFERRWGSDDAANERVSVKFLTPDAPDTALKHHRIEDWIESVVFGGVLSEYEGELDIRPHYLDPYMIPWEEVQQMDWEDPPSDILPFKKIIGDPVGPLHRHRMEEFPDVMAYMESMKKGSS